MNPSLDSAWGNMTKNSVSTLAFITNHAMDGVADQEEAQKKQAELINRVLGAATSAPILRAPTVAGEWGAWAWGQLLKDTTARVNDALSDVGSTEGDCHA